MLSDTSIKEAMQRGEIKVDPCTPTHFRPSGLIFHLGTTILVPAGPAEIDVRLGISPDFDKLEITLDKPYPLKPREFILAETFEIVTLDVQHSLVIEGRSTLARLGLTVVQTATLVYPGHTNRAVTLELANHGPYTILLYPTMKIARGMFFHLSPPASYPYDSDGKYQEQGGVGSPLFVSELNESLLGYRSSDEER